MKKKRKAFFYINKWLLQNTQLVLPHRKALKQQVLKPSPVFDEKDTHLGLDLYKYPPCTEIRKMRNKRKHNNVTVANQFTVHNCYYKIFLKWKNTDTSMVFFPPFHRYQKMWGLVVSLKKGQSSKSNFYHNSCKFLRKFGAFDFTEQTLRTDKDQNIWRQFLQLPQTLQWAHLRRAN